MTDAPDLLADERAAVVEWAPALADLTPARTGNLSVRGGGTDGTDEINEIGETDGGDGTGETNRTDGADETDGIDGDASDQFAITPTGVAYDRFDAADVPVVDLAGEQLAGGMTPSSEVPMHRHIYRAIDAGAIVHTHSTWATTMAVLRESLPPIHYMLSAVGREVPVAEYAPYGTRELAENVVDAMDAADADACFIENHGLVVTADDLPTAVENTRHVENLSQVYLQARSVGEPTTLSGDQLATVEEKFANYGQPDQ